MRHQSLKRQAQLRTPGGIEYVTFLRSIDKPWCWSCGSTFGLARLHLMAGSGAALRVPDRRAINCGCPDCHRRHVHDRPPGEQPVKAGRPYLTDSNMLWIKRERDPEFWDPDFVGELWIKTLPEPQEPDLWYRDRYMSATGDEWRGWNTQAT